ARHLRLTAQLVDDHAAVLDGDDIGAANHTGLGVHDDLGDLNAADLAAGDAGVHQFSVVVRLHGAGLAPFPLAASILAAELGREFFPAPALTVLVHHFALFDGGVGLVDLELLGDLREEIVAGRRRRDQRRRRLRRASCAATGAGRVTELALADLDVDVRRFEPQDFGSDNRSDCALPGAEVLRGAFGAHGAAAADSDLALVRAG